jgi:glucose/mannose-6-phosphate isomerase
MVDSRLLDLDKHKMYQNIVGFPNQIRQGLVIGATAKLRALEAGRFSNIVLAGMGGSAIGGDLVKSLVRREIDIPFEIHRNYGLPTYVGPNSLIICSSYSGATEETLTAFKQGLGRKCHMLCITTGGELARLADESGIPTIIIPPGLPPRAALGYSFTPILIALGRLRLINDYSNELEKAAEFLAKQGQSYQAESTDNHAYNVAELIHGKIIIIYAGADLLDTVAMRFKGQICENSKQLAFCNVFPEFNHNELVGWELSKQFAEYARVIILKDKDDHPQISKRMAIISNILTGKQIDVINLESSGQNPLERLLSLVQLADYTSYYMALLNEVDPTPIEIINYLKHKLTEK